MSTLVDVRGKNIQTLIRQAKMRRVKMRRVYLNSDAKWGSPSSVRKRMDKRKREQNNFVEKSLGKKRILIKNLKYMR